MSAVFSFEIRIVQYIFLFRVGSVEIGLAQEMSLNRGVYN
jgi:hypothetical protein